MNERKIQKSLKQFMVNPFWKEYYETAPTGTCKRYIELEFYYSDNLGYISDYEELKKESDKLEKMFVKADWEHLYKYCGNNPKKVYYKNKLNNCK